MPFDIALKRFCLSHAGSFVVPAECLDRTGLQAELARTLIDERRISEDQLRCLERGYALYLERCADLFARAPGAWFPPRQTNLLIVEDGTDVLPYLEPFAGTSALLYLSDLDTDPEYVALLLLHIERLALVRSVRAAVICNLSYWLDRDAESRRAFARAAASARRPDAAGFVALAEALAWVDDLLHDPLRLPAGEPDEPYVGVNDTDLYVPKRLQGELLKLAEAAEDAVRRAMRLHGTTVASRGTAALNELCEWLERERAHVVVVSPEGSPAWTPDATSAADMRRALHDADDAAVASIHADLRVIHERSRQFLDCVRDVESLPSHCPVLETGGGAYVDAARRAVVYELVQPAFDARRSVAPPYHRLLLGARVVHEWGHIAHTAKMIGVPPARRADYARARAAWTRRWRARRWRASATTLPTCWASACFPPRKCRRTCGPTCETTSASGWASSASWPATPTKCTTCASPACRARTSSARRASPNTSSRPASSARRTRTRSSTRRAPFSTATRSTTA
jgi:hypothetical protein